MDRTLGQQIQRRFARELREIQAAMFTDGDAKRARLVAGAPAAGIAVRALTTRHTRLTIALSHLNTQESYPGSSAGEGNWHVLISIAASNTALGTRSMAPRAEADAWATLIVSPAWAPHLCRAQHSLSGLGAVPTRWYALFLQADSAAPAPVPVSVADWTPLHPAASS